MGCNCKKSSSQPQNLEQKKQEAAKWRAERQAAYQKMQARKQQIRAANGLG